MSTPLEVFGDIVGGYQQGAAAKANARIAEMNARTVVDQAARDEGASRRDASRLQGAQIAATGASGVTTDSSYATIVDDAIRAEEEALAIRYRGHLQGVGYRNEARQLRLAGSQAIAGGYVKGAISYARGIERAVTAGMGGR